MAITGISHLGIAVGDLEAAIRLYRDVLGLEFEERWVAAEDGIEAASFRAGDVHIELMRPLGPDTPVGRFLARRGEGLHHICYRVDSVADTLINLREAGLETIDQQPRPGGGGRTLVGFVHPRSASGVLTELEQPVSTPDPPG